MFVCVFSCVDSVIHFRNVVNGNKDSALQQNTVDDTFVRSHVFTSFRFLPIPLMLRSQSNLCSSQREFNRKFNFYPAKAFESITCRIRGERVKTVNYTVETVIVFDESTVKKRNLCISKLEYEDVELSF